MDGPQETDSKVVLSCINTNSKRNNGRYTIGRSAFLRLCSSKRLAAYHTIIATCKAQAISVCDYLKKFFMACVDGRTDYERSTLSLGLSKNQWGTRI